MCDLSEKSGNKKPPVNIEGSEADPTPGTHTEHKESGGPNLRVNFTTKPVDRAHDEPGYHENKGKFGHHVKNTGRDKKAKVLHQTELGQYSEEDNRLTKISAVEEKIKKLQKDNDALQSRLDDTLKENEDLKEEVKGLEKDNDSKTVTLKEYANKDIENQQKLANYDAELPSLKESFDELKVKKSSIENELRQKQALFKKRERLVREMEILKKENDSEKKKLGNKLEKKNKKIEQKEKEIKDTNETLARIKSEKEKAHKQIASDEQYKRNLHDKIQSLTDERTALQTALNDERNSVLSYQYNEVEKRLKTSEERIRSFEEEKKQLEVDKQGLLLRLGKVDGANVTYKNPNITELSDEKRPTRLAEEFSELYDNQWTDAFEEIEIEDEEQKTTFMLELLTRANKLCVDLSREHIKKIKTCVSTLTLPIPSRPPKLKEEEITIFPAKDKHLTSDEINPNGQGMKLESDFEQLSSEQKKTILDVRRFFGIKLSDEVEKAGTDIIVQEKGINKEKQETVVAYIKQCINVCWSMCRHEPPVYVDLPDVTDNIPFDTNKYKPYTKTGKQIDYIVWPALYLHEGGPMLSKGVAQGKQKE